MVRVLVIGGLTLDKIRTAKAEESRVGGGAYYCSVTAARLGGDVELRTVIGSDMPPEYVKEVESEGVNVVAHRSSNSIQFVNTLLGDGRRVQQVVSVGGSAIGVDADTVSEFDVVQITPVLGEVDPKLAEMDWPKATAIEAQGFVRERRIGDLAMRHWDDRDSWTKGRLLLHLSDEELLHLCNGNLSEALTDKGPEVIALTRSSEGSFILTRESVLFVPSLGVDVIDDVGCGDVYAMTMVMSLFGGKNPLDSAVAATAAATLNAEGRGLEKLRLGKEFREREDMTMKKFQEFGLLGRQKR